MMTQQIPHFTPTAPPQSHLTWFYFSLTPPITTSILLSLSLRAEPSFFSCLTSYPSHTVHKNLGLNVDASYTVGGSMTSSYWFTFTNKYF